MQPNDFSSPLHWLEQLGFEYVSALFAQSHIHGNAVIKRRLLGIISVTDILKKSNFGQNPKSNFELYCKENPNAPEARM